MLGGRNESCGPGAHAVTSETRDDARLLALITEQDRAALGSLYDRYAKAVFSLAVHMLRDSGAAEEVTQDTFFNVWRRSSSYHSKRGSVAAWLFSIARHRSIDELRRRRREQTHVQTGVDLTNKPSDGADDPVEFTIAQFERGKLRDALHTLRPEQREVVVLAYYGGLTHGEIATRLGHPLGTVKTRMRLGLKKLRETLGRRPQEWADHGL